MPILPKRPGGEEAIKLESLNAKLECVRVAFQPLSFLASQHPGLLAPATSADQNTL